jgi:predicted Zn-dependent protease
MMHIKCKRKKTLLNRLLFALFFSLFPLSGHANSLPDLGSPDLVEYDTITEENLGRAFTNVLYTQYNLYTDLETSNYIQNLGHKLASFVGSNRNFSFYIIDDSSINAFAGPDGVIGIHTGLIKAVQSEDELAAVIAHEISHVTQNHLSRRYEYSTNQANIGSIASVIAAILIGMQDPNAGMAALMGGMGYNLQEQLKNSRQHESEADHLGIELLYKAGYNSHAMGDFFGRLSKASQNDAHHVPEFLKTHPVTENRLADAENRAQNYPSSTGKTNNNQLKLIKLRLAHKKNINFESISNEANDLNKEESCYRLALNNLSRKQTTPKCLLDNAKLTESSVLFTNLILESATNLELEKYDSAKKSIEKLIKFKLELYPTRTDLAVRYAKYLQAKTNIQQAIDFLNKHKTKLKYRYPVYKELAELYLTDKKESEYYFNIAQATQLTGDLKQSKYLIEQAEKKLNPNATGLKREITLFKQENTNLLKKIQKEH